MSFIREAFVVSGKEKKKKKEEKTPFPPYQEEKKIPFCTKASRDWPGVSDSKEHNWLIDLSVRRLVQ